MTIVPLAQLPDAMIEALLDRAFGAGRHARTAYRLRAGAVPIAPLSFAALDDDGRLMGSIQCWPVDFLGDDGHVVPMVMVGPVAVEPPLQRAGVGRRLMQHMLAAVADVDVRGADALMLVGDPEYYGRFGFDADRTAGWRLPGPFEPRRLLARGTAVPAGAGSLAARGRVDA